MFDALSIYLRLGWRNLWLHPLRTGLTTAALAIGIAALTFLSAMNDGWMQQIKTNFALTVTGHIQIHARGFEQSRKLADRIDDPAPLLDIVRQVPEVRLITRRVRVSGLASSAGASGGALVYGVEPATEKRMSRLAGFVSQGGWLEPGDDRGVVLGDGLADSLEVGLGDKIVLMATTPQGDIASEVFRVRGLLHSGVMDVDDLTAVVTLDAAQRWLGLGKAVTDIVVRVKDFNAVASATQQIRQLLAARATGEPLETLSWIDIDPMAEQWAEFADAYTWIILAVVILVVLAEVLNTMLMSMHERVREFGLMGALGVQPTQVFVMVVWETVILVALGSGIGFLIGGGLSWWYGVKGIDLTRFAVAFSFMYMDPVVHPLLRTKSIVEILGAAVIGALVSGLYPAWKAARLQPAVALREL
ncbi:MAG TPA: ABC transporter permease [Mariprofundaceae bacterium]|nr:ABC transporter permease [Mariprofundaceae bacterium]